MISHTIFIATQPGDRMEFVVLPFRRGHDDRWQPSADDFSTDLEQARAGGAAGWCFHNGDQRSAPEGRPQRSFDLRGLSLFDQLDAIELRFIEWLLCRGAGAGAKP